MFKLISLGLCLATAYSTVPSFVLDFDEPPAIRYNQVFLHFKDTLLEMETMFLHSVAPKYRDLFQQRQEWFRQSNPEAFYAMQSLGSIIGMETYETLLVNSIVDFSSWCTSIVARMSNGTIVHARNLDFDFPQIMVKLVYTALIKKDNVIVAEAPAIAGYIGFYTGLRYDTFTVSYNVRILRKNVSDILENIEREFEAGVVPTAQVIQRALIESTSYTDAVQLLSNHPINTPCYVIVGGKAQDEGIVIARDRDGVNRTATLGLNQDQWFVAQGNFDYWSMNDPRYIATQQYLLNLTQEGVNPNSLVTEVLHKPHVLQSITIFTASMSASLGNLDIYLLEKA